MTQQPQGGAWGASTTLPTVKTAADLFHSASTVAQHKDGLKLLVFGLPETMKTGFCLSFPEPIYFFDTELGAPPLFRHFVYCPTCKAFTPHNQTTWPMVTIKDSNLVNVDGKVTIQEVEATLPMWTSFTCRKCNDPGGVMKDIRWCDATFLNPQTGVHDAINALKSLQAAIALLANAPKGCTIILDSGTDVWDWIQEWIDEVGKHTAKNDQLMKTEWHKARLAFKKLLLELFAKPVHFVMTAQTQDIYDKTTKQATGEIRPRVENTSPHSFDLVILMKRYEIPKDDGTKKLEYHSAVWKCRFQKDWRPKLPQELTYEKLTAKIVEDLGVEVW